MGGYGGHVLKKDHPLMQQFERLKKQELSPLPDTLEGEELMGQSMHRMFLTQEEKQIELDAEWAELDQKLTIQRLQWASDQFRYQEEQTKNKNDKTLAKLKTAEEIALLREERREKAVKADERKEFADKARHGFYKFVGGFVKFGRWISGADKAEKETRENPEYELPGLFAEYWRLENMRPDEADPEFEEKVKQFNKKYGPYYESLKEQYEAKNKSAQKEATETVDKAAVVLEKELTEEERADKIEKEKRRIMEAATYKLKFGDSVRSQVEGGTKPNAFQYAVDGSQWLMKTNHSCIGAAAPNASIMTVAGYKVQKLVDENTAIEAFESKSKGVGTVSLQRMVEGVVSRTKKVNGQKVPDPNYVDLFRFSRTPESMTPEELKKIEALAPQFLREYMTDFLLGNYDTKGENFLICRDKEGKLIIRGIDKEAAGRKDLVPEAQHMQKDKHFFDQDTVYNQLFRMFADGTMNFDLNEADQYIKKIEQMSTKDYMKIYAPYLARQQQDRTPEEYKQIERNVTYRKEFIRVEARRFFGELVRERMQKRPEEAEELKQKYLGGVADGIFIFNGETAENLRAEREMIAKQKESDADALKEKVKKADEADEKSYNRRHAVYDFAKKIIMGNKKKPGDDYVEQRTTKVKISELDAANEENWDDSLSEVKEKFSRHLQDVLNEHKAELTAKYKESLTKDYSAGMLEDYKKSYWEEFRKDAVEMCRKAVLDEYLKKKPELDFTDDQKYLEQIQRTQEEEIKVKVDQLFEENKKMYEDAFAAEAEEAIQDMIQKEAENQAVTEFETTDNAWAPLEKEALLRTEKEVEGGTVDLKMVKEEKVSLGGTKPMSQYIAVDGTKWLAKQAVTCVGTSKPSGAILTEIGSNIQKMVDEKTAVEAFKGQTKTQGMVSFQRRLEHVVSSKQLDLFKFSRHPELATQATTKQVEALMPQILREHMTDWLLCNFDTKGENFVLTQEGVNQPMVLHGIDKEAAFNKILDPKAMQMSTTYKPHANNTLYNVVFEKFANAEMDFDLRTVIPYVEKVMQMSDEDYMAQYQTYFDYLTEKADGKAKELAKVDQIKANILARKSGHKDERGRKCGNNLKEEYIRFFTQLIERRCAKLHPDEAKALREKYYGAGGNEFRF